MNETKCGELLAHPALPALLRAMLAVAAVLTRVAGVRARAGCGGQVKRSLVEQ